MSFDDVLIGVIIVGIGLSGAYFRAEYAWWRSQSAAQRRQQADFRRLHRFDPPPEGKIDARQPPENQFTDVGWRGPAFDGGRSGQGV